MESESCPDLARAVNVGGTRHLIDAMKARARPGMPRTRKGPKRAVWANPGCCPPAAAHSANPVLNA